MLSKYFLTLTILLALVTSVRATTLGRFQVLYSNDVHGETEPCG